MGRVARLRGRQIMAWCRLLDRHRLQRLRSLLQGTWIRVLRTTQLGTPTTVNAKAPLFIKPQQMAAPKDASPPGPPPTPSAVHDWPCGRTTNNNQTSALRPHCQVLLPLLLQVVVQADDLQVLRHQHNHLQERQGGRGSDTRREHLCSASRRRWGKSRQDAGCRLHNFVHLSRCTHRQRTTRRHHWHT